MNREELAWAAGVFTAKGCCTHQSSNGRAGEMRLSMRSKHEELLLRFVEAIGVGRVCGPYANNAADERDGYQRASTFTWFVVGDNARRVLGMLSPWLIGSDQQERAFIVKHSRQGEVTSR